MERCPSPCSSGFIVTVSGDGRGSEGVIVSGDGRGLKGVPEK